MHVSNLLSLVIALATIASAALDASTILQIAPKSAKCAEPKECRTAEQAAPFIFKSLAQYDINCPNEMAAVISLMAFESADFQYKHNVFPGRAGQGTANMQMAPFNLLYAKQIDGVKDKVANITSVEGLSDNKLNFILSLVQPDEHNFGSGPWFLTTQCKPEVRAQLNNNVDEGFKAYMQCVGVTVTDDRKAYLDRAKKAFGLS